MKDYFNIQQVNWKNIFALIGIVGVVFMVIITGVISFNRSVTTRSKAAELDILQKNALKDDLSIIKPKPPLSYGYFFDILNNSEVLIDWYGVYPVPTGLTTTSGTNLYPHTIQNKSLGVCGIPDRTIEARVVIRFHDGARISGDSETLTCTTQNSSDSIIIDHPNPTLSPTPRPPTPTFTSTPTPTLYYPSLTPTRTPTPSRTPTPRQATPTNCPPPQPGCFPGACNAYCTLGCYNSCGVSYCCEN